jgi:hypothetical protein
VKGLRGIFIVVLAAALVLGSVVTVFAKGPPSTPPGKENAGSHGKQGFFGNITAVNDGNVSIATQQGNVTVTLNDQAKYKIVRVMNKWGDLTDFESNLGGVSALAGERVVFLAGNITGTLDILKFMVLPMPGTQPLCAHQTGLVYEFNAPSGNNTGNITIVDVHGVYHTFTVGNDTIYRPMGTGAGNITGNVTLANASFVTVVTTGNPDVQPPPLAKAIVLHASAPKDWPKSTP